MRRILIPFYIFCIAACTEGGEPGGNGGGGDGSVSAEISGVAFLEGVLSSATVEIVDLAVDEGGVATTTSTDEQGAWAAKLGARTGSFVVKITGSSSETPRPLTAFVQGLGSDERREGIPVTAFTHLAYQYQTRLEADGLSAEAAQEKSERLVFGHFANIAHGDVVPRDARTDPSGSLTDEAKAGILAGGLRYLARKIAVDQGFQPDGLITTGTVVAGLAQDIGADGVFDGVGTGGRPVLLEQYAMSGDTLRSEYALAINAFLSSVDNSTVFGPDDLASVTTAIAGNQSEIFPIGGAGFDPDGPAISFVSPEEGAVVSGSLDVEVTFSDEGAIALAQVEGPAGWGSGELECDEESINCSLTGVLDTTLSPDGELFLVATAEDELGNASEESLTLIVNNTGPVITVSSPATDTALTGVVTILVTAESDDGVARLDILNMGHIVDEVASPGTFRAEWDTTGEPEGAIELVFEAEDFGGLVIQKTVSFQINNTERGSVSGTVALDSRLMGATVEVFGFESEELVSVSEEEVLTGSDGSFYIEISDEYAGPLLVKVFGSATDPASYIDAATGQEIAVDDDIELVTLIDHYEPGLNIQDTAVHAVTTLCVALIRRYQLLAGMGLSEASETVHRLFGQHLKPGSGVDVRRKIPADLSTEQVTSLTDNVRMGLFHAGLSRMGAEISDESGIGTAIPTTELLGLLKSDLRNAVFDGRNALNQLVNITPDGQYQLETNTLRYNLAAAIDRFVRNEDLAGLTIGRNTSGLVASALSVNGGFYDTISENTSALFGDDSPVAFDQVPPEISISGIEEGERIAGIISTISATCFDNKQIEACEIVSPAGLTNSDTGSSSVLIVNFQTTEHPDGELSFSFLARDGVGQETTEAVTVVLDNTGPAIGVDSHDSLEWVNSTQIELYGQAQDDAGIAAVTVNGAPAEISGSTWSVTVTVPEGTSATLSIIATDGLGNSAEASHELRLDLIAPEIIITQPSLGDIVGYSFVLKATASDNVSLQSLDIRDPASLAGCDLDATASILECGVSTVANGEGEMYLRLGALDAVQNDTEEVFYVVADHAGPLIEVSPSGGDLWVSESSVVFLGSVTDEPAGVGSFLINGSTASLGENGGFSFTGALAEWPAENIFTFTAVDAVFNAAETVQVSISSDVTSPEILGLAPAPGDVVGETFTITGCATENVPGAMDDVWIVYYTEIGAEENYCAGADAALTPEGAWCVSCEVNRSDVSDEYLSSATVRARDHVGNTAYATVGPFVVDNTPPSLVVTSPEPSGWVNTTSVVVDGNATEGNNGSGVEVVRVSGDGGNTWTELIPEIGTGYFSATVEIPACNVSSSIRVVAEDFAGHATESMVVVNCDDDAPQIGVNSGDSAYHSAQSLILSVNDNTGEVTFQNPTTTAPGIAWAQEGDGPTLHLFHHRLDLLPDAGLDNSDFRMPVLAIDVETSTGQLNSALALARWRYLRGGVAMTDFQDLSDSGTVIISYQTLGASFSESTDSQVHHVEVEAVDTAGNSQVVSFPFKAVIYAAPVAITGCSEGQHLGPVSLQANNLENIFDGGEETFLNASLRYVGKTAESSPVTAPKIRLKGASLWDIGIDRQVWREERCDGSEHAPFVGLSDIADCIANPSSGFDPAAHEVDDYGCVANSHTYCHQTSCSSGAEPDDRERDTSLFGGSFGFLRIDGSRHLYASGILMENNSTLDATSTVGLRGKLNDGQVLFRQGSFMTGNYETGVFDWDKRGPRDQFDTEIVRCENEYYRYYRSNHAGSLGINYDSSVYYFQYAEYLSELDFRLTVGSEIEVVADNLVDPVVLYGASCEGGVVKQMAE